MTRTIKRQNRKTDKKKMIERLGCKKDEDS